MKLTYDKHRNIAYMAFREPMSTAQTLQIADDLNVDLAPDGTVAGIEFLNASLQLGDEIEVCDINGLQTVVRSPSAPPPRHDWAARFRHAKAAEIPGIDGSNDEWGNMDWKTSEEE